MEQEETVVEEQINNVNKTEKRFTDLTQKAKELGDKAESAEARALNAEKERDFFSGFSDSVAKTPQAAEFKDEIKAKVMSGYSVEDATVSILHAKGKLSPQTRETGGVAGGSATNQITNVANKTINELSRDEKRQALVEAVNRGDIGLS